MEHLSSSCLNGHNFDEIYAIYKPKITSYINRIVGKQDCEDITQEVFMKVSGTLTSFRGASKISTWIYRIATNTAIDHLRKVRLIHNTRETGEYSFDDIKPDDLAETGHKEILSLDSQLIRKEMNACIRNIVYKLPASYRVVLVLSEMEGFHNIEIARITGLSLETVKIRLHRARTKLRKELEANCNFYRDERNEFACDQKTIELKILTQ